jgi:hypothetical protein
MNLGEIETEVREMYGFPTPAPGGTDKLVQATIWKYINDAFSNMVNALDGLPHYIEFTVDTSWVFTVTAPAGESATISKTSLDGGDHYAFKVSNLRSWGDIVNLTDGTGQPRGLSRVIYNERGWKSDQVKTQSYFDEFDIGNHGMVLLPKIDQTNTIGLDYQKKATEMTLTTSTPDSEIETEYHNKYPVMYACMMLALSKEDTRMGTFLELAGYKDKNGNFAGMLGDFVDDFQLSDLGTESYSIAGSHGPGDQLTR